MELDIKKWTDLFTDTKSVRPEYKSRNRNLLKGSIKQKKIIYGNMVFKTNAKIKVSLVSGNEVSFSGDKSSFLTPNNISM